MPKIKVNDINLYYEVHGQGQPIVFVSGFSGDHSAWQDIIKAYTDSYQVIVFDNRGIGGSDSPGYPYTTEMMADDTVGLVKALGINSAHFVGHSFGGCIVQTIARKYPEVIKSVVIASSFLKCNMRLELYGGTRLELMTAQAPEESITKFVSMLCWSNNFLSRPGMVEELVSSGFFPITISGYKSQLNAMLTFDSRKWMSSIECPCLIICADEDLLADVEDSQQMRDSIKNSQYYCFHKVGHVPMVEQPQGFNDLVLEFIGEHN